MYPFGLESKSESLSVSESGNVNEPSHEMLQQEATRNYLEFLFVSVWDYEGSAGDGWSAAPEHRAVDRRLSGGDHHAGDGTCRTGTTQ